MRWDKGRDGGIIRERVIEGGREREGERDKDYKRT